MRRWPKRLWTLITAFLVVTAVVLWFWPESSPSDDPASPSETARAGASNSPARAERDPEELSKSKNTLELRAEAFSEAYFSRDTAESAEEAMAEVARFATDHFLQTGQFGFDPELDTEVIQEEASWSAEVADGFEGELIDPETAEGSITLTLTKSYPDGSSEAAYRSVYEMVWVREAGNWFVYEVTRP